MGHLLDLDDCGPGIILLSRVARKMR